MNKLPFEIIEKIYLYIDNTKILPDIYEYYYNNHFSVKMKKICLLDLKKKTGYFKKKYENCLNDIKYENALYESCVKRKNMKINNYFFRFILARNRFMNNIIEGEINPVINQRNNFRKNKKLPDKAIIVTNQRI